MRCRCYFCPLGVAIITFHALVYVILNVCGFEMRGLLSDMGFRMLIFVFHVTFMLRHSLIKIHFLLLYIKDILGFFILRLRPCTADCSPIVPKCQIWNVSLKHAPEPTKRSLSTIHTKKPNALWAHDHQLVVLPVAWQRMTMNGKGRNVTAHID